MKMKMSCLFYGVGAYVLATVSSPALIIAPGHISQFFFSSPLKGIFSLAPFFHRIGGGPGRQNSEEVNS